MSFASCASDTTSDSPMPNKDMKTYLQVRVTVDGSGDTRASRADKEPQGGEDGNGREPGTNHENDVNSLAVLLYESDKDDLSDDNAIINYVYTFTNLKKATTSTSGKDATYTTVPKEIDAAIVGKNYHVIVIANADDMTSRCQGMKISEVRDLQMSKVCTRDADITKFSNFIMSSKKDAKIDFSGASGSGTEANPYLVDVDIERLAARIDIIPNAEYDETNQGYYYDVKDGANVIGGFKLESVTPSKVMTKGEYLIKRVSQNKAVSAVTYFGLETKDAGNKATNYVVCPWTKDRTGLTLSNAEGPASLYNVKKTTSTSTTTGDASYILDYVMENTTTDNEETYSTGLIFKGKYYEETDWDKATTRPKAGATGTEKEYTYTLRHSDPSGSGTKDDPMHFGVVRNNIYQVKVEGVEGKSKGLTLTIHVRKWATYTHKETTM